MIDAEVYPGGSEPWCCVALGASGFSAQTGEEYVCIYIMIIIYNIYIYKSIYIYI